MYKKYVVQCILIERNHVLFSYIAGLVLQRVPCQREKTWDVRHSKELRVHVSCTVPPLILLACCSVPCEEGPLEVRRWFTVQVTPSVVH